jgi:uncharacterized protein (TIGR03437 family)
MRSAILLALLCAAVSASDFTTFIGDVTDYSVARVVADSAGNTYLAGTRYPGVISEVFVMKLDPAGNIVLFRVLNGKGSDAANDMAVDSAGNIYIAGSTSSPEFPLHNALQSTPGPGFVTKLSPDASQLLFSTYFPAAINGLAVDAAGNVYVTGSTIQPSFPTTAGLPAGPVGGVAPFIAAAFLTKISADGSRIVYSTRLSGSGKSCGEGSSCFTSSRSAGGAAVAVDPAGNAYVAGNTDITSLPTTPGAFLQTGPGPFVAKVNAAGNALVYLTYLSNTNLIFYPYSTPANTATALAVDAAGNAYVAGSTVDPQFPATPGAWQTTFDGPAPAYPYDPLPPTDCFVAKVNPTGTALVWASYLGGKGADVPKSVALDPSGNIWLTGVTASPDFPNAQGWSSGGDFVTALNPSGSALAYSARYPNDAVSQSVAVDASGVPHLAGPTGIVSTVSPSLPPLPRVFGIANAAYGPVSGRAVYGEVISIYGPHIGPSTPATFTPDSQGFVPTLLGGVQVYINGVAAPLLYVSDSQINAVVSTSGYQDSPYVQITSNGATGPEFPVTMVSTQPQIFQGPGAFAAAVNQDNSINSASHPAKAGSIVSIWATGVPLPNTPYPIDQLATAAQDFACCQVGVGFSADNFAGGVPTGTVTGTTPATVTYSGASPGIVRGVVQINFQVPALPAGTSVMGVNLLAGGQYSTSLALVYVTP